MLNTSNFAAELKQIIESSCPGKRPFVCDGYPSECHVMIVGTNPATPLDMKWSDFWKHHYGFDYNLFVCKYKDARKKPGRSRTRPRLDHIRHCLDELHLKGIETNVYAREAKNQEELWEYADNDRFPNHAVLNLLTKALQPPKAIIPHGDVATSWSVEQKDELPADVKIPNRKLPHLRNATDEHITYICDWLKRL